MTTQTTITREGLAADGLAWLLETTFLVRLSAEEQDAALAGMEWRAYRRHDTIIRYEAPGLGVDLIVDGQVVILAPDEKGSPVPVAQQGPGNLIGERALFTGDSASAAVEAVSNVRSLHMSAAAFRALLARSAAFKTYVAELINLRDQWRRVLDVLLRNPFLRFLGKDDLERLAQSSELVRFVPGAQVIRQGDGGNDVYVVVEGRLSVWAPASEDGARLRMADLFPGELVGHVAVLLEAARNADVVAEVSSQLLRIGGSAFLETVTRNPQVQRHLMQHLAIQGIGGTVGARPALLRQVTLVCAAERGLGTTTLAYGLGAALREAGGVLVVDLDGEDVARRLGLPVRPDGDIAGVPVDEMQVPEAWGMRVIWPRDRDGARSLVRALHQEEAAAPPGTSVIVAGHADGPELLEIAEEFRAVVHIRRSGGRLHDLSTRRDQVRFQAIRLEADAVLPLATNGKAVRVPNDAASVRCFWSRADLTPLGSDATILGRSCARLARLLRGRSVGLALGGGGALGFAHIGLLRVLHEAKIPVDFLSGVSFGALVGALYVAGGLDALEELLEYRLRLLGRVGASAFTTRFVGSLVDKIAGGRTLGETEIPFYPVGLDVSTGREFILSRGTLGAGVRSSSSFPGLFPALGVGASRIVDGGIVNNVPASVVWEAGADFIIGSNIIPRDPLGKGSALVHRHRNNVVGDAFARLDDLLRSLYTLMSQTGRDRALLADYVFELDVEGFNIYDFGRGREIAEAGEHQARRSTANILYAYETDESVRF